MKTQLIPATCLTLAMAAFGFGQSVDGKWAGEQAAGRGGPQPVTLELKSSGTALTGTMKIGENAAVQIADGKVDAGKVSFKTTQTFGGNEVQITWDGEMKGDELTLNRTGGGRGGGGGGGGGRGGGRGGGGPLVLKRTN